MAGLTRLLLLFLLLPAALGPAPGDDFPEGLALRPPGDGALGRLALAQRHFTFKGHIFSGHGENTMMFFDVLVYVFSNTT